MTLSEFLLRESRPHPASTPKKAKKMRASKKSHLKGVAAGQLLTQQAIIDGIKGQEAKERETAERKAEEKTQLQEVRKQARTQATVERKRQRAEEMSAAVRQVRQLREAMATPAAAGLEGGVASESEQTPV